MRENFRQQACRCIKKSVLHRCFLVYFTKFLRVSFFKEQVRLLLYTGQKKSRTLTYFLPWKLWSIEDNDVGVSSFQSLEKISHLQKLGRTAWKSSSQNLFFIKCQSYHFFHVNFQNFSIQRYSDTTIKIAYQFQNRYLPPFANFVRNDPKKSTFLVCRVKFKATRNQQLGI